MNEREPTKEPSFTINTGEEKIICTPSNTHAYLYEDEQYDHLYYIKEETDTGYLGYHIFRQLMGAQFDIIIKKMINEGYEVYSVDEINEEDLMAYRRFTGEPDPDSLIKYRELGPTLDRKVANWGKFLQTVEVTVEDFA
jgi:hypothetical protein